MDGEILFEDCKINKNSGYLTKWLLNYYRAQLMDKISVDVICKNTTVDRSLGMDNAVDSDYARVVFE